MQQLYEDIKTHFKIVVDNFIECLEPEIEEFHAFCDSLYTLSQAMHKYFEYMRKQNFIHYIDKTFNFQKLLSKIREQLWNKTVENYQFIYKPIYCAKNHENVIVYDLLFLVISTVNVCNQFRDLMLNDEIYGLSPFDIEYIKKSKLARTKTTILDMSVFEVVDSLKHLSCKWDTLEYHPKLLLYIDLLEFRCSLILCFTQNTRIHNVEDYRTEKVHKGKGYYVYNQALLNMMAAIIINAKRRIYCYFIRDHTECPTAYSAEEWKVLELKCWLKNMGRRTFGDKIYTDFRMNYLPQIACIGEMEEYMRRYPNDIITDQKVYRRMRGDNAAEEILEFSSSRDADQIMEDSEKEYPNSMPTMAFILLRGFFASFNLELNRFIMFRNEIEYRCVELRYENDPMLIQTFNLFYVFYGNKIYKTEGFLHSFIVFMNILEQEHDYMINNETIDMRKLYTTVFGSDYFSRGKTPKIVHSTPEIINPNTDLSNIKSRKRSIQEIQAKGNYNDDDDEDELKPTSKHMKRSESFEILSPISYPDSEDDSYQEKSLFDLLNEESQHEQGEKGENNVHKYGTASSDGSDEEIYL